MPANGNYNDNGNFNNIIFSIKDTKFYDPAVNISPNDNGKLSKLPSGGFKRSVYWNEYKTKSEKKIQQMNLDIFSNETL